jgi:hypothetical protein
MNFEALYYRIRPLAKLRAEQCRESGGRKESSSRHPVLSFLTGAFCSVVGGIFGGFVIWINLGFNPENSGGTLIFLSGAILMSSISVLAYAMSKDRYIFYGLNVFTGFVLIRLTFSLVQALFADHGL